MIPGSKGHKSDASLLAGGFLNLGPAKNMSKKPFFEEKWADYECFKDCESAKHVAIWYQRGQNTFCHNIKWYECQKWILILTSYKYKFTIFTDCIERKYGKDWLL